MGGLLGPLDDWAGDAASAAGDAAGGAADAAGDVVGDPGGALGGLWDTADDIGGGTVDATGDVVTGGYETIVEDPLVAAGSETNELLGGAGSTVADWTIGTGEAVGGTVGGTAGSAVEGIGIDKVLLFGVGALVLVYVLSNSSFGESAGDLT